MANFHPKSAAELAGGAGAGAIGRGVIRPPVEVPPPAPAPASTEEALTLDALMARQKMLAAQQGGIQQMPVTNIPQGMGQLAWTLVTGLQQRRAEKELAAGNADIAGAFGKMDPTTGALPSDALATIMQRNPDLGAQLYAAAMQARAAAAKQERWEPVPTPQGETGQWYRDAVTGKTQKVGGSSEGGGGTYKVSDIAGLRKEITNLDSYSNMANAEPMWVSMQDANKRDTPQADLNMVIALAKLFDPTSVVRTEEGEMVRQTGGIPSELVGYFKMLTGDPTARLAPDVRKGMMQEAHSRMSAYDQAWKRDRTRYEDIVTAAGLDPEQMLPTFADVTGPAEEEPPPASVETEGTPTKEPEGTEGTGSDGKDYIVKDGKWVLKE
jgi:hypothetical protein